MKSRVSIDVDHDNQPVIKIEHSQSEDVRDKLVKKFLTSFGGESRWAEFYFTDNSMGNVNSTALVRPLSIFEVVGQQENFNDAANQHRKFLAEIGREIPDLKSQRVLDAPVRYSLADCLRELKFGRPGDAQQLLDKWIAEAESLFPPPGRSTANLTPGNNLLTNEEKS